MCDYRYAGRLAPLIWSIKCDPLAHGDKVARTARPEFGLLKAFFASLDTLQAKFLFKLELEASLKFSKLNRFIKHFFVCLFKFLVSNQTSFIFNPLSPSLFNFGEFQAFLSEREKATRNCETFPGLFSIGAAPFVSVFFWKCVKNSTLKLRLKLRLELF